MKSQGILTQLEIIAQNNIKEYNELKNIIWEWKLKYDKDVRIEEYNFNDNITLMINVKK